MCKIASNIDLTTVLRLCQIHTAPLVNVVITRVDEIKIHILRLAPNKTYTESSYKCSVLTFSSQQMNRLKLSIYITENLYKEELSCYGKIVNCWK